MTDSNSLGDEAIRHMEGHVMMKTSLLVAFSLFTMSCGAAPGSLPRAPTPFSSLTTSFPGPGASRRMAVQESVTGNAEVTDASYPEGVVFQKYFFNANRRDDGTVTGEFELHQEFAPRNATLHGHI